MLSTKIEILRRKSSKSDEEIKVLFVDKNWGLVESFSAGDICPITSELAAHVEKAVACQDIPSETLLSTSDLVVYTLTEGGPETEFLDLEGDETVAGANHWLLPGRDFDGVWESLIFEDDVKDKLLHFVESSMLFSRQCVDQNIIACNRLVLLHGPPGTGKTTLCKAIAQKIAIHTRADYNYTHLIEINAHSLFSKWFSESGKLVMNLFEKIKDVAENPKSLVCVLIDEVESIAYSRGEVSSNEPTDSLRVVNAVLTQLDRIRKYPNVLVLATSNLTDSIDEAFVDRADIVQFIGNPNQNAIYSMYSTALQELIRAKIIMDPQAQMLPFSASMSHCELSLRLKTISAASVGLSGRTVKKIPFLAHALFLHKSNSSAGEFLDAMMQAVRKNKADKGCVGQSSRMDAAKRQNKNKNKNRRKNSKKNEPISNGLHVGDSAASKDA